MKKTTVLQNGIVYSDDKIYAGGFLSFQDGKIKDVGQEMMDRVASHEAIHLPDSYHVIPEMIDVHIHGANGADTMDATYDSLKRIANVLPQEGVTSFLATTMTQERDKIENALRNAAQYIQNQQPDGHAELLGVHLEGPFISEKRAGAQPVECILKPDLQMFLRWQEIALESIKMVTIAPELEGSLELINYLSKHGVIASIGHTDATYEEVLQGIQAGASHVTHLFNGMRGLHHREPGVVGAVLLHDEVSAELIADGIHVRSELVKLTYLQKGREKVMLITDAMRAKCLGDGLYDLGGQKVTVQTGRATLYDGTLAGSVLKMTDAARNTMKFTDCSIQDILYMTSVNPAKQLNIFDRKGSLSLGKDADVVVLDEQLEVVMAFCRGQLAYCRN
ncbi:N-acetylglucosamine-6-phosphate deacetylase [Peribacillus asahii]|uniref:N-acetylglucosamine-6-phosphate deacetylase n=1 Tax=Peribacillus asahii TaxID=228899 RepID=UPI00207A8BF4|nr:N-acetylglucosamine-6-phosphate deacetylase [Peribacillus asahii]USK61835.1 N-acetylglucosamine-6-phosphate deacetylase [Peribacillus asahii]